MGFENNGKTIIDLADILLEFEKGNAGLISGLNIAGANYYVALKSSIYFRFFFSEAIEKQKPRNESLLQKAKRKITAINESAQAVRNYRNLPRNAEIMVYASDLDTLLVDGKYQHTLFDDIVLSLPRRNVLVGYRYQKGRDELNLLVKPDIYFPALYRISAHKKSATAVTVPVQEDIRIFFETIISLFKKENIDVNISADFLVKQADAFYREFLFFKEFLADLKPKRIITSEQFGTGFCAAAKSLNIPVIDFQHGAILHNDGIYHYHEALRGIKNKMNLPDQLVVFGEMTRQLLLKRKFWDYEEIKILGNKKTGQALQKRARYCKNNFILFPTQGGLFEESAEMLEGLKSEKPAFRLIIKLHPLELPYARSWYENFVSENPGNFQIAGVNQNVYDILHECRALIGFNTTLLFESASLGIPTFTLNKEGRKLSIHDVLDDDQLREILTELCIDEPGELTAELNRIVMDDELYETRRQQLASIGDYIFADNYAANVRDLLAGFKDQ